VSTGEVNNGEVNNGEVNNGEANAALVPWELVIVRAWRKVGATLAAALSIASIAWQVGHPNLAFNFVFHPDVVARVAFFSQRMVLVGLAAGAGLLALPLCIRALRRVRRGGDAGPLHREIFLVSLMPMPLLGVPGIELEHPLITGLFVVGVAAALAWVVQREAHRLPAWPDLTRRQAVVAVAGATVLFASVIGFLSYWRYITFHSQLCDSTWETNAVWGIVHHGYPTISVNAWMYDGKPLPAPYFNNHVPFGSYLFAPFFALYQKGSTIMWLQAAFMGLGAIGAYLVGKSWLGSRLAGALAAWLYVLNPVVQSLCLHDMHPNILVIPATLLAVGLMENGRPRAAIGCAIFVALCHEETPVYAAALGLYWMFSGEDRRRFRLGLAVVAFAGIAMVSISGKLMSAFGGHPRWDHFNLFFDERRSSGSLMGALLLNPIGALVGSANDLKLDYLALSLASLGGLAIFGWRALWFALPTALLMLPANSDGFYAPGMNYSTPLVPAVLLMSLAGLARQWKRTDARARRAALFAYVATAALFGNFLWGNIASKTFKLEYGFAPFKRQNQYNYRAMTGYMDALPPFGPAERALWEVVDHVPAKASVATSWAVNPQLATRDVSLGLTFSGGNPAPAERVDYVVIDKLPQLQVATEPDMARFRADPRFKVFYENEGGVIFQRIR
jgi:uncharacterized membrane protein